MSHPSSVLTALRSLPLCSICRLCSCSPDIRVEDGAHAEETNTAGEVTVSHEPVIPPEPRLQVDLSVGSPDLQWWRDSMKGRDERIKWWQEARFGCFIHWNASAVLAGEWKGEVYHVRVLEDGFELAGEHYRTLSATARAITGSKWNGYVFFGLKKRSGDR